MQIEFNPEMQKIKSLFKMVVLIAFLIKKAQFWPYDWVFFADSVMGIKG